MRPIDPEPPSLIRVGPINLHCPGTATRILFGGATYQVKEVRCCAAEDCVGPYGSSASTKAFSTADLSASSNRSRGGEVARSLCTGDRVELTLTTRNHI